MPKKMVCIKKCYYKSRVFEKGTTYIAKDDEVVPKHFEPFNNSTAPKPSLKEPDTMYELQRAEDERVRNAVGHKTETKKKDSTADPFSDKADEMFN